MKGLGKGKGMAETRNGKGKGQAGKEGGGKKGGCRQGRLVLSGIVLRDARVSGTRECALSWRVGGVDEEGEEEV